MSAIDLVLKRVASIDEHLAMDLLAWLDRRQMQKLPHESERPLGARAMIGFAHRDGLKARTTAEWMKELREADND